MEISKCCPKCGKDYAKDMYWKSSLKKHLARKNPCDSKQKYIRETKKSVQKPRVPSSYLTSDEILWRLLIV